MKYPRPKTRLVLISLILTILCSSVKAQNFSTVAPDSIKTILNSSTPHLSKVILEIGKTNRTELIDPLKNFLQTNNKLNPQVKWSAHLALARLGEPNALNYVVQRIQKLEVNDDVVYELFPGLVYTRQKQAINYLVEIIQRDEKNCKSADPENSESINCAYRVLEFIAPVIKDFPIKTDASGDLQIGDYTKALKQARDWFSNHQNYELIIE